MASLSDLGTPQPSAILPSLRNCITHPRSEIRRAATSCIEQLARAFPREVCAAGFEEPLIDATVSVVVDDLGEVLSVHQAGVCALGNRGSLEVVQECIRAAKTRRKILRKMIDL